MRRPAIAAACLVLASPSLVGAAPTETSKKAEAPKVNLGLLHVQVILDHLGFSPGVLDGRPGKSMAVALKGFQESRGLPQSGKVDDATLAILQKYASWRATKTLRLSAEALAGPYVNPIPSDPQQQAALPALSYRSPMEKLAEMFHTTPQVLLALNSPYTRLVPGTPVVFPNALPTSRAYDTKLPETWRATLNNLNVDANSPKGASIVVDKSDQVLRVLDKQGNLIAQFQATMGSEHDPLPLGSWKVRAFDYNPTFHYNPALFWDAKPGDAKTTLPAGPNGPVGVAWLALNIPHYGIHGTAEPTTIGRAESHGCIRLTNWDVARLALMIKPGTPAIFQE
ncbi:MAG TPA: L,D-transpeptidase [Sphingomonas sp.]|nr:L,D-transpeptidase [Sphingomonas sp.]